MEEALQITCPFCYQFTFVAVDSVLNTLTLIEDCQNCCNPIKITIECDEGQIINSYAERDN